MTTLARGFAAIAVSLLLSIPLSSYAQILSLPPGGGAAPAPDLSCTGRGADGKLSCGDVGLEKTAKFCDDIDGDRVCDDKDECPDTPPGTPVFMNGCHEMELSEEQPWVLRGVNFEFDKAVLLPESISILDAAVNVLNKHPDVLVSIDGHTDSKGSDWYNESLSRRRAKTVYEYFLDHGIKDDRLVYRGYGESRPMAPNSNDDGSDNPQGRAENRRVELNVLKQEDFAAAKAEIVAQEAERQRQAEARAAAAAKAAEEAAMAAEEEEPEEAPATEYNADDYLNFTTEDSSDTGSADADMQEEAPADAMPAADDTAMTAEDSEPAMTEESAPAAEETAPAEETAMEPEMEPAPAAEETAPAESAMPEESAASEEESIDDLDISQYTSDSSESAAPEPAPASESGSSDFNEDEYLDFLNDSGSSDK